MQDVTAIATAISGAAFIIAGALRWAAGVIARALRQLALTTKANTDAQVANTGALEASTAALAQQFNVPQQAKPARPRSGGAFPKIATVLFPFLALAVCCAGCTSGPDPLIIQAMERDRQVWEEDRRRDLDPEKVTSRLREFEAHERYARSK